jgi:hypothetical protein
MLLTADADVRKKQKNMVIGVKKLLWCYRHEIGEAGLLQNTDCAPAE